MLVSGEAICGLVRDSNVVISRNPHYCSEAWSETTFEVCLLVVATGCSKCKEVVKEFLTELDVATNFVDLDVSSCICEESSFRVKHELLPLCAYDHINFIREAEGV